MKYESVCLINLWIFREKWWMDNACISLKFPVILLWAKHVNLDLAVHRSQIKIIHLLTMLFCCWFWCYFCCFKLLYGSKQAKAEMILQQPESTHIQCCTSQLSVSYRWQMWKGISVNWYFPFIEMKQNISAYIIYISCWHKLWKGALIWHHCKQEDRFEIFMASFLCSQIDHYPPATYSLPAASDIQFNSPKALFLGKVIGKVSLYNWLIHQVFSENGKHCKHLDNDVCNFCSRMLAGRHWGNPLYISSPLWNSPPFLNAAFSRPAPQMNLRGNADSSQTALIFCLGHPSFSATDLLNKFPGLPTSGFNDSPSIHSNRGTFFQFSDREGIDIISSKCFVG